MLIHLQNLSLNHRKNKLTILLGAMAPGKCPMSAAFGELLPWLAFQE